MSFRQVKFKIKRDVRSKKFNEERRRRIYDELEELIIREDPDNNLDTRVSTIDELGGNPKEFQIILSNIEENLDLKYIKERLNAIFDSDYLTFDYEIVGGKRRSLRKKITNKKRRSSQKTHRSSQRRRLK